MGITWQNWFCVFVGLLSIPPVAAGAGGNGEDAHPETPSQSTAAFPKIFAEGVVSTSDNEFSTAFSPDGRVVYYSVSAPDLLHHPFVILESHFTEGKWGTPQVSSFSGGPWSDADPFVSPDGSRLFFMSKRPATGTLPRQVFDLWVVKKNERGWGEPVRLGNEVNSDQHEVFPSVTRDGALYFSAIREDGQGGMDMYRARRVEGRYETPLSLRELNTEHSESNPLIAPDESFLIFSSDQPGGLGGSDLYVSLRRDGLWTPAENLGESVNSEADDFAPALSPDGSMLYFTSRRHAFASIPPGRRLTYSDLLSRLRRAGNGNGDIYFIPTKTLAIPR